MSLNRLLESISYPALKFFAALFSLRISFCPSLRQNYVILLASLVSAWVFPMIFSGSQAMAEIGTHQGVEFLLFYGNDVRGETDPCG